MAVSHINYLTKNNLYITINHFPKNSFTPSHFVIAYLYSTHCVWRTILHFVTCDILTGFFEALTQYFKTKLWFFHPKIHDFPSVFSVHPRNRAEKYSGTVTGITATVRKMIHKVQDWIRYRMEKNSLPYAFCKTRGECEGPVKEMWRMTLHT